MRSPHAISWVLAPVLAALGLEGTLLSQSLKVDLLSVSYRSNPDPYDVPTVIVGISLAYDLDGDGHMDVVSPTAAFQTSVGLTIHWNCGNATFEPALVPPPVGPPYLGGGGYKGIALGDLDGDGRTDMLLSQSGRAIDHFGPMVFLNRGVRSFQFHATGFTFTTSLSSTGVYLLDADGDLDLDALFFGSNYSGGPRTDQLFLNDGAAHFTEVTATHLPYILGNIQCVAIGDYDRDGDLDLAYAVYGAVGAYLLANDGQGHFSVTQTLPCPWSECVVTGDLDRDGDLDLFFCGGGPHRLLFNDGLGNFVDRPQNLPYVKPNETTPRATLADLDGDGSLDIVISAHGRSPTILGPEIWLNDGTGRFGTVVVIQSGNEFPRPDVVIADFDRDGDPDLLGSTNNGVLRNTRLWTSTARHLHCPSVFPRGTTVPVLLDAEVGKTVHVFLGVGRPPLWVPAFGFWALDPLLSVPLGQVAFPDGKTRTLPIPVPNQGALSGLSLTLQGVLVGTQASGPTVRAMNWLPFRIS